MPLLESGENYLETILVLTKKTVLSVLLMWLKLCNLLKPVSAEL